LLISEPEDSENTPASIISIVKSTIETAFSAFSGKRKLLAKMPGIRKRTLY
jgi:hypothetical protein